MTNAVAYCRVSTTKQAEKGVSLDTQIAAIRAYADTHGYELTETYVDVLSGTKDARPQYQRMLAALPEGGTILCWRLDRMGRRKSELFRFFEWCKEHAISLISVTQPELSHGLIRDLMSVLAAFESEQIAARVLPNMEHAVQDGKWVSRTPYGFRLPAPHEPDYAGGHLVPDPATAPRAPDLWRAYLATASIEAAARAIGVTPFRAATMLRSRAYRGDTVWRGITRTGTHPALVPPALWDAAFVLITARAATDRRAPQRDTLLSGLLLLDTTDHRLYYSTDAGRSREPQWSHDYYKTRHAPLASVRRDYADALLLDELRAMTLTPRARTAYERDLARVARNDPHRAARAAAERERTRIAAARVKAADGWAHGVIDDATYATLTARYDADAAANDADRAALPPLPDLAAATPALNMRIGLASAVNTLHATGDTRTLRRITDTLFRRVELWGARTDGLRGQARKNALRDKPPWLVCYLVGE